MQQFGFNVSCMCVAKAGKRKAVAMVPEEPPCKLLWVQMSYINLLSFLRQMMRLLLNQFTLVYVPMYVCDFRRLVNDALEDAEKVILEIIDPTGREKTLEKYML